MGESKYDFIERPRAVSKPPAPPLDPENDDVPDAAAAPIPPPSGGADATTSSPPEGSSGSNRDIGPHQTLYSASGVAGGILGLLLGGPVLALLFVGGLQVQESSILSETGQRVPACGALPNWTLVQDAQTSKPLPQHS